jgi:multiple sugar transport system permease protein
MMMVYWLAGLQSLPRDIYESASIDGANAFQAFRHITVPLLLPIGAVVLLLCVVECLHVFDLVKTLTNGGPYFATDMMDLYIYRQAFDVRGFPSLGYASAAGIFFGLSVFAMTLVLVWISRRAKAKD